MFNSGDAAVGGPVGCCDCDCDCNCDCADGAAPVCGCGCCCCAVEVRRGVAEGEAGMELMSGMMGNV